VWDPKSREEKQASQGKGAATFKFWQPPLLVAGTTPYPWLRLAVAVFVSPSLLLDAVPETMVFGMGWSW